MFQRDVRRIDTSCCNVRAVKRTIASRIKCGRLDASFNAIDVFRVEL